MPNFSLGEGIDTIIGEKKNNGADIFSNIPAATTEQIYNYPEYEVDVDIINSQSELHKFLNIQTPFIATNPTILDSIKLQIADSIDLKINSAILIVKFRKIYKEKKLNLSEIRLRNLAYLPENFSNPTIANFYRTYGDEFITKINYGREFYAVIEYPKLKNEKLIDIKKYLMFFLNQIQGSQLLATEELIHKKNLIKQYKSCKVYIKSSGNRHDIPNFVTTLNDLIFIVREFDKDVSDNHVQLDYKSLSYTAFTHLGNNANNVYHEIAKNIIIAKNYLYSFNKGISKLDSLLNNLEHFDIKNAQAITNLEINTLRNKIEIEKSKIQTDIEDVKNDIPEIGNIEKMNKYNNKINKIAKIYTELELCTLQLNTTKKDTFITSGKQRNNYKLNALWMQKTSSGTHLNLGMSGNINSFWHVIEHNVTNSENNPEIKYKVYRKKKGGHYHDLGVDFKESGTFIALNDYSDEDKYCIAKPQGSTDKCFTVAVRKL